MVTENGFLMPIIAAGVSCAGCAYFDDVIRRYLNLPNLPNLPNLLNLLNLLNLPNLPNLLNLLSKAKALRPQLRSSQRAHPATSGFKSLQNKADLPLYSAFVTVYEAPINKLLPFLQKSP